jgi:hypothetical protein
LCRCVVTEERTVQRSVIDIVTPRIQPGHGRDHRVRLVLEPGHWEAYDPFLMMAEDWFTPGTFGDHPHRGIETVTLVLEGELLHRDNHGGEGILKPGDAQWMTAGRGIIHLEEPHTPLVHSLQLWVNLPARLKLTAPRYQDLRAADLPVRREPGAELRVYSGASNGVAAATRNHLPITMVDFKLEPGAAVTQAVPAHHNAFIYVLEGAGRFGAERKSAQAGQVLWLSREEREGTSEIAVQADSALHAVLWAGPPVQEPVVSYGPFVMNTEEEIRQAYADYQAGKF